MAIVVPPAFSMPLGPDLALLPQLPVFAAAYHALLAVNRERLAPWEPSADRLRSLDEVRAHLENGAQGWLQGVRLPTFLATPVEGGWLLVGVASVSVKPEERAGEVGYWVDAAHEGRSYAARAVGALLEQSFTQLGLHRVTLRTDVENERSRRLAVRLGFHQTGISREALLIGGTWRDEVGYELLSSDWQERSGRDLEADGRDRIVRP